MAKLIYSTNASLDGYIEDAAGNFDFSVPDAAVHFFINDQLRPIGTHLYGRRLYETMLFWETAHELPDASPETRDFTGIWQAVDKVVFSRTLTAVSSRRTRLEREFDPEAIRRLKATSPHDLLVGGADLAGVAFRAGLVDELRLFTLPILLGGGKPALPSGVRVPLELLDDRRFPGGQAYRVYRVLG